MAAISVLAIVAGFQWLQAERQRQSAAQALKSEAQVTVKLQEQLRQASWANFNQAERTNHMEGRAQEFRRSASQSSVVIAT